MDERTVTPLRWINITNTDELIKQVRQEAKEIQKKKKKKISGLWTADTPHEEGLELVLGKDFRYEKREECEYIRCDLEDIESPNSHGISRLYIIKYKDMMLLQNYHTGIKSFTKDGITIEVKGEEDFYKTEKFEHIGITFDHTDPSGTKKKFRIKNADELSYCTRYFDEDPWYVRLSNATLNDIKKQFEKSGFQTISEKFPDGTYRKYDDKDRIICENLPDGTSTTWNYDKRYTEKQITKGNETTIYKNDEYAGKIVKKKEDSYTYNAEGTLIEKIIHTPGDPDGSDWGETEKTTYFDNGYKNTEEILAGNPGTAGNKTYYDPENDGKVIAYTSYNGTLIHAYNADESRKAMINRFHLAMEEDNIEKATENLLLILSSFQPFGNPEEFHTDWSLLVRNQLIKTQIEFIDNNKVAIGGMFEDRHWVGENYRGNGIQWYWKTAAAVLNIEDDSCGLIASCSTERMQVRHPTNSEYDLWDKLDSKFMEIDPETGVLTIGLKKNKEYGGNWETKAEINIPAEIEKYNQFVASATKHTAEQKRQRIEQNLQQYRTKHTKNTPPLRGNNGR